MDKVKFEKDFEEYKTHLSEKLDKYTVNLMLHAFCMGHCKLAAELNEELVAYIELGYVFDKINELSELVKHNFEANEGKETDEKKVLFLDNVSNSMLLGLPENTPLYKDSGLWQLRTDDMEEIIISQKINEDDFAFIERCKSIDC